MSENKVSLKGLDDILKLLTSWLKTPEERNLYSAKAEEKIALAGKIKSKAITGALQELAKAKSLELENLHQMVDLYTAVGRSEKEIQALLDRELEWILETYNAVTTLKELTRNGVILNTKVRQIEPPSKPEDTETE